MTGGDLEGEDPVGWFAIMDVRILDALGQLDGPFRWLNPLFGYHLVAASIDWSSGDFFLLEWGTHVGLLLPFGDSLRFVARYGLGSQESEQADGWTNHVGTVTVEARLF